MRLLPAIFLIYALLFMGCKLDPPIYPTGGTGAGTGGTTVTPPEVDTGIDPPTDATYTIPIGDVNTVIFQIDGAEIVTLNAPTVVVTPPNAQALNGYTSILATQTTPDVTYQLNFSAITVGERANDLLGLLYKIFKLSDDGTGKIKTTTFKKIGTAYHIRGYFRVLATDGGDGSKHTVIGSFNIAQ